MNNAFEIKTSQEIAECVKTEEEKLSYFEKNVIYELTRLNNQRDQDMSTIISCLNKIYSELNLIRCYIGQSYKNHKHDKDSYVQQNTYSESDNHSNDQFISVKEMANMLGISLPTAYDLTERPGFPLIKLGRKKLVVANDVKQWIACENKKRNTI